MGGGTARWHQWREKVARAWALVRHVLEEASGTIKALGVIVAATAAVYTFVRPPKSQSAAPTASTPAPTPAANYAGIQIMTRRTTLDLHGWRPTRGHDILSKVRRSRAVSHNRFEVERVNLAQRAFAHRFGTSSLIEPSVVCEGCRVDSLPDQGNPGMREWDLVFDISQEKVNQPFPIEFSVTFWNAFQRSDQWWGGFRVLHPTDRAVYVIAFPPSKHPRPEVLVFESVAAAGGEPSPIKPKPEEVRYTLDKEGGIDSLEWTLTNPLMNRSYRVGWKWDE